MCNNVSIYDKIILRPFDVHISFDAKTLETTLLNNSYFRSEENKEADEFMNDYSILMSLCSEYYQRLAFELKLDWKFSVGHTNPSSVSFKKKFHQMLFMIPIQT